jgi:phenylacetyl-CoA:acceptor oxidoreductase subunit 2
MAVPFLVVGSLIPLILIIIEVSITTYANIAIIVASILVLVSGWYMKFTIVTRAAHVQGFSLDVPRTAS